MHLTAAADRRHVSASRPIDELYRPSTGASSRIARRILADPAEAEDVAQDVFAASLPDDGARIVGVVARHGGATRAQCGAVAPPPRGA